MSLKHTISSKFHIGDWILKLKQQGINDLVHSSLFFKQHCWLLKPKPFNMYFGIKENHIQLKELKFILVFINVAHATSPSVNRLCNCSKCAYDHDDRDQFWKKN